MPSVGEASRHSAPSLAQVSGGLHFLSVCFVSITGSSGVQGPQRGKPHQHRDRQADRRPQRAGECGAHLPLSGSVQVSLAWPLFGGGTEPTLSVSTLRRDSHGNTSDTIVRQLATCK